MRWKIFTLIELLIVISVIAVLAAMLLPALSLVREKANAVSCTNNLKQLGLSFAFYVDANRDFYPVWRRPVVNNEAASHWNNYILWSWVMVDYGFIKGKELVCPTASKIATTYPSESLREYQYLKDARNHLRDNSCFEVIPYGYNMDGLGGQGHDQNVPPYHPVAKAGRVNGDIFLLMDTLCVSLEVHKAGYALVRSQYSTLFGIPYGIHQNRTNILWVDGHVSSESVKYDRMSSAARNPYLAEPFQPNTASDNHWTPRHMR